MSVCKFGLLVVAVMGADGVRSSAKREAGDRVGAKFIAGVPIMNYYDHVASHSLMEEEGSKKEWVLMAKPRVTAAKIHALCMEGNCIREGHPDKGGIPFFEVQATENELTEFLTVSGTFIEFVERDFEVRLDPDTQDERSLFGIPNTWGLRRVGVGNPWTQRQGAGVHVYVMDTGIRTTHRDFQGRAVPALDMTDDRLQECNGDVSCAGDNQGHGSHCAGTVGGKSHGVAPQAKLYSVKVLGDSGSGKWSWILGGLDWVSGNGEFPAVASLSLGAETVSQSMKTAIDAAVNAGVVVVVAAGNSNSDACGFSPAFVPSAITVGSTTRLNSRSSFSNWGPCMDIWAPGSNVFSVGISTDISISMKSGTSMACPHVAGAVALYLAENPSATSPEALDFLVRRAKTDKLSNMKTGDANKLLWVGA